MIGSILANMLLVIYILKLLISPTYFYEVVGCCFLVAGMMRKEELFNTTFASTASSLLTMASTALIIPTALFETHQMSDGIDVNKVAQLSHGIAIVLLILFAIYLNFRLNSHSTHFESEMDQVQDYCSQENGTAILVTGAVALSFYILLVAICSFLIIDNIEQAVQSSFLQSRFIGIAIIPLLAEGADRVQAIKNAYKHDMDKALRYAIGRSMETALFTTPLTVLLGWVIKPKDAMTLRFEAFETVAFYLSNQLVSSLVYDGKSNYLEGTICLAT
jgi:Ca2+:H+ antiporter